ncbi:MAG: UDP-2,4-diacetamido-2,4,6-trideoxy-beta-L-altropyranose hydrolase [Candidatus Peribacteraceae bacterium]
MSAFIFRTDASSAIGTGHVMRCLALAQEMRIAGHDVHFVMAPGSPLVDRLKSEGIKIHTMDAKPGSAQDTQKTVQHAKACGADWVIVDGYQFDTRYQDALKENSQRVLFIDDYGNSTHYNVDIVLNQNIYATEDMYPRHELNTTLLLGTKYVLLRQEFLSCPTGRMISKIASNILVTLGGSDPKNVTGKVVEALRTLKDVQVKIVVGGANPNLENLQESCKESFMEIIVDTHDMKKIMEWADIAVSGGGSTCYELAYIGLPALSIILADNQKPVVQELEKAGVVKNGGWHADVTSEKITKSIQELIANHKKREVMSKNGTELIDGKGAMRVLEKLLQC